MSTNKYRVEWPGHSSLQTSNRPSDIVIVLNVSIAKVFELGAMKENLYLLNTYLYIA